MSIRKVLVASTIAVAVSTTALGVAAADETDAHCLAHTSEAEEPGALRIDDVDCFDTFSAVLDAIAAPADIRERVRSPHDLTSADMDALSPRSRSDGTAAASASLIGIHFDGPGATGSSFSVSGSDCSGGYLNVTSAWNNRISSTINGCPTIRHFDLYNIIASYESTTGFGGTLSFMDNRTSSIQYL